MTKKILITGGNGFIAKNLLEGLGEYDILAPNSKELNLLDFKLSTNIAFFTFLILYKFSIK